MKRISAPLVSVVLHLAAGVAVARSHGHAPPPAPKVRLQVSVVEKAKLPPPPPQPVVAEARKPALRLARAPVVIARTETAPPPPSNEAALMEAAPVAIGGISFESTSASGSFAVAVGNTLSAAQERVARDPGKAKPYKAERYAAAAELAELPEVLNRNQVDIRRYYPKAALQSGLEGEVVLRLTIDADGSIAEASVVKDPGDGMGAAALRAVREFRFAPGKVAGAPVATAIPFVIRFVLS